MQFALSGAHKNSTVREVSAFLFTAIAVYHQFNPIMRVVVTLTGHQTE